MNHVFSANRVFSAIDDFCLPTVPWQVEHLFDKFHAGVKLLLRGRWRLATAALERMIDFRNRCFQGETRDMKQIPLRGRNLDLEHMSSRGRKIGNMCPRMDGNLKILNGAPL